MTAKEFKELKPEFADLDGDPLWDAMGDYMREQQRTDETIRSAFGFFKRYQLRKLYYRKYNGKVYVEQWRSSQRCVQCKKGVVHTDFVIRPVCPHCKASTQTEPNENLSYRIWLIWSAVKKKLNWFLNLICIVGSNPSGRYGMFGDESKYVIMSDNFSTSRGKMIHKPRRWWEYIFVKR